MKDKCIFCEFVEKKEKVKNHDYPFHILHERPHSISFLSIDFPATEDGHVLVIPKKHHPNLEEIPKYILHDIIEHVSIISRALKINNEANNILLNNGKSAGQYVFHTHFHLIPRNKGDNIKIEVWKRKEMTKKNFINLQKKIQSEIEKILE